MFHPQVSYALSSHPFYQVKPNVFIIGQFDSNKTCIQAVGEIGNVTIQVKLGLEPKALGKRVYVKVSVSECSPEVIF